MTIVSALVGLIRAIPIIDGWFQSILTYYITTVQNDTLSKISDAAAFAARAKTDEERYEASEKWRLALAHVRIS